MVFYQYSVLVDFIQGHGIADEQLRKEIQCALVKKLDHILVRNMEIVKVFFNDNLTGAEKIILDNVIANHIPGDGLESDNYTKIPREKVFISDTNEYSMVSDTYFGGFMIDIHNNQRNAPNGTFTIMKNNANHSPTITKINGTSVENTKLNLSWSPDCEIDIAKTSNRFDGLYSYQVLYEFQNLDDNLQEHLLFGVSYTEIIDNTFGANIFSIDTREVNNPIGIYAVSKSSSNILPSITVLNQTRNSITNEKLLVHWDISKPIELSKSSNSTNILSYMKNFKNYTIFQRNFTLNGTTNTEIGSVNGGNTFQKKHRFSGFIIIEGLTDGFPCAIFSVSKNVKTNTEGITLVSSSRGYLTGEKIVLTWPTESFIQIKKNGNNHDGVYRISIIA